MRQPRQSRRLPRPPPHPHPLTPSPTVRRRPIHTRPRSPVPLTSPTHWPGPLPLGYRPGPPTHCPCLSLPISRSTVIACIVASEEPGTTITGPSSRSHSGRLPGRSGSGPPIQRSRDGGWAVRHGLGGRAGRRPRPKPKRSSRTVPSTSVTRRANCGQAPLAMTSPTYEATPQFLGQHEPAPALAPRRPRRRLRRTRTPYASTVPTAATAMTAPRVMSEGAPRRRSAPRCSGLASSRQGAERPAVSVRVTGAAAAWSGRGAPRRSGRPASRPRTPGVRLTAHRSSSQVRTPGPDTDLADSGGPWPHVTGLPGDGVLLVRSDQVAVWRTRGLTINAAGDIPLAYSPACSSHARLRPHPRARSRQTRPAGRRARPGRRRT